MTTEKIPGQARNDKGTDGTTGGAADRRSDQGPVGCTLSFRPRPEQGRAEKSLENRRFLVSFVPVTERGKTIWVVILGLLLGAAPLFAQIEVPGNDPGRTRWSEIRGGTYRLIYPVGMDSLALSYYNELQRFSMPLARSIGFVPGSLQFGKTPVILHPFAPYSNGSVTWAPRRMELYTMPEPYNSLPQPWVTQLAVHEGRHLAQMQFGYKGGLKYPWYGLGEMWIGALAGIYPGPALLEGDAVVAETALTRSGRGRTADFLGYYHVAFDNGDWRDWYKWRYGSYLHYAPDYYAAGYMIVAGTRYFFNDPLFTRRYFKRVNETPWKLFSFQNTVRTASGRKFRESWQKIMQSWRDIWQEEAAARAPFDSLTRVTPDPVFATDYGLEVFADGKLYATKEGLSIARQLITFDEDGKEKVRKAFAATTSALFFDPNKHRMYWSETIRDPRWELAGKSIIRYFNPSDLRFHDLTSKGRLFNPRPSPDGEYLSCVEYPVEGGSRVAIIRTEDGSTAWNIPAPGKNEQLTEVAWTEETLYALAISDEGYTIWTHDADGGGEWKALTQPSLSKMHYLDATGDTVEFVSDRSGVKEWYNLDVSTGKVTRMTNSKYGGSDYILDEDGESLWCISQTQKGMMVFKTDAEDLRPEEVDLTEVHKYRVADRLTEQEDSLAAFYPEPEPIAPSEPVKYSKGAHLFKFHSWAPIYFNYDSISSASFDFTYRTASLGVTGLFQNELGTAYGFIGYSAHKNPQDKKRWKHSLHGKFTYTGWYPVIEASFDFNDRNAIKYGCNRVFGADEEYLTLSSGRRKAPYICGDLSVYIPFNFSKGGWLGGFIPQVKYSISNDIFNTTERDIAFIPAIPSGRHQVFFDSQDGVNVPLQNLTVSARGYWMRPLAPSNVYPSVGVGAELGAFLRPGLTGIFSPGVYAYLYGYAPGFWHTQGFRFSAMYQQALLADGRVTDVHLNTLPRGFNSSIYGQLSDVPAQVKLTVDYAIPIFIGDISVMSPVVYIKNLQAIPHFDISFIGGTLFSAGADLTVKLANLLWFPFDCSVGVSLDVNGGSRFNALREIMDKKTVRRFSAGFIFSMDI